MEKKDFHWSDLASISAPAGLRAAVIKKLITKIKTAKFFLFMRFPS
jgi:hypothetical protein